MHAPILKSLVVLAALSAASVANALIYTFTADLNGASESPPVASGGTGTSTVVYDSVARTLDVEIEFSGLTGNTTVAHIHAPTAVAGSGTVGIATYPGTFPGFPAGVTEGSYAYTVDLSLTGSYTASFLTLGGGTTEGAEAGLLAAMLSGKAYVNVHTSFAPGGEIRGFLARVPDSSTTLALFGASFVALVALRRRCAP